MIDKNKLVLSRFLVLQEQLNATLNTKPIFNYNDYNNSNDKLLYESTHFKLCYYGCNKSTACYKKCYYSSYYNKEPLLTYEYKCKKIYTLYKNKQPQHWYNCNFMDSIWFNIISGADIINITGCYEMSRCHKNLLLTPNPTLYLNNIPMTFIVGKAKNFNNNYNKCIELKFVIDMKPYCDTIDYIIRCRKKNIKSMLFSYLPIEIIYYILHLSSV
jgi:hypothetical protein